MHLRTANPIVAGIYPLYPDYRSRQNSILIAMHLDSGATRSLWVDGIELPPTSALTSNIAADVCIVGAGISGLTTAYLLSREGLKVVVIDDGPLCGGDTGRTTAHLANEIDDSYQEIESLHGREGARLAAESHTAAIDLIERLATGVMRRRTSNSNRSNRRSTKYLLPSGCIGDSVPQRNYGQHRCSQP
jgi:hypothetical protein